jgi:hypothetical protein
MCAMTTVNHILAAALCMLIATTPVAAQGKSQAPGQAKKGTAAADSRIPASSTASSPTNTPSSSASSVIYYGSWLDDASIVPTGGAWVGLSTGYWKADALSQIDAPVISAVVGLNSRLQIGGSVPIYHFRDGSGLSESGIGNIAIYGKALIIDPATHASGIGVAVAPLVEISSSSPDRIGWALPLNVEIRRERLRMYGSGGYFSRGSVFGSFAAEVPVGERVAITGTFGQSFANAGSHQTSLGVSAGLSVSSTASFYIGLGKSFQPAAAGPGGTSLAGGASFLLPSKRKP